MESGRPLIVFGIEDLIAVRGGVNVLIEALIDGLRGDYRVGLISMDAWDDVPAELRERLAVHFTWRLPTSKIQARKLAEDLHAAGASAVHLHGGTFGWGQRFFGHSPARHLARLGIKVYWTDHTWVGLLEGYCGPKKPFLFKLAMFPLVWFSRVLELRAMVGLIAVSRLTLEKEQFYYWPARGRMKVIYHSRLREERESFAGPRENTIVSVGHVAWRKGQLLLVRAFRRIAARFPDWRLLIIGPCVEPEYGRQADEEAAAPELSGRVEVLGQRGDAMQFVGRAGIFVQPSVWEGLPLALQEAMFLGTPCAATNCQGNDELVVDETTGLLCPVNDEPALAAVLARLIEDEALRSRLGAAGRAFVLEQGMTQERMVANHRAFYAETGLLRSKNHVE